MHHQPSGRRGRLRSIFVPLLCLHLLIAGALAIAPATTSAQGELTADQQAILDEVKSMVANPDELVVQQRADGSYLADIHGSLQPVLLAALNADGEVVTRCVETLEEAAAFLAAAPGLSSAANVDGDEEVAAVRSAVERNPELRAAAVSASQTAITIINLDGPGEGFNDTTPAAPVGGNQGTTVGQQRLKAFEYAAGIWASYLQSNVPIAIEAKFDPLTCTTTGAVLGSAGPKDVLTSIRGSGGYFPGTEKDDTWYVSALANKVSGADQLPGRADITATFNSELGSASCLPGSGWYYGFDGNEGPREDLVIVLLHEFGHGLGFLSLVDVGSGANHLGENDIWNYYVMGSASGGGLANILWKDMSATQRRTSITSNNLVWSGANVTAAAARLYRTSAPQLIISNASGESPIVGAAATFGPLFSDTALAGPLVAALDSDEDGADAKSKYTTLDACNPLTNGAAVNGAVALVNRGPCAPSAQVRNLQNAGAIAAVIADNVSVSTPPELNGADSEITIPAMGITRAAGDALRQRLQNGSVQVSLVLARANVSGIDPLGRVNLYAPGAVRYGSSVSHFDIPAAGPNLLMEPAINTDLSQSLDLTDELLVDIGWFPDLNYNGLDDRRELSLSVSQTIRGTGATFPSAFVQPGQPFSAVVTVSNQGFTTGAVALGNPIPQGYIGASWSAAYTGGAAGPAAGTGDISAELILPPGASATFTIAATAPSSGSPGANVATISKLGGASLVDTAAAASHSSSASARVFTGEIQHLFLPAIRQ